MEFDKIGVVQTIAMFYIENKFDEDMFLFI